ncbi:MAG: hypothetical protein NTX79_07610 [Candidatus Micrarchaeota archaeon]|nr:hypothetical protein [Candidatus Micrarchaeota archaeon]
MFIFQAQAEKKESGSDAEESRRFGMKAVKAADFMAAAMAMPDEQFAGALVSIDKAFKARGISDFMGTLTPGAQNAIYASSFVWGYENAAKYVQNAMKLDEVKNAASEAERSKVVVESVQQQASGETKNKQASAFAWGYYNDDMKQTQAQSGVSETVTEKEKTKEEAQQQSGIVMPLSASEAVSMGIAHNTAAPELLYCSAAGDAVLGMHEKKEEDAKRERLERLEGIRPGEPRIIVLHPEEERQKAQSSNEIMREAEKRQADLVSEHAEAERRLEAALDKLDTFKKDGAANAKKIAAILPSELARAILSGSGKYAKRRALRKKLESWLAFSRSGKGAIASLPLGRLLKLASLSSLLK